MTKLHVVLGAGGSAGNAIVRELLRQGKKVRAVTRSGQLAAPAGVEVVKGDVTNPLSVREACKGAAIVYQCAQPEYTRWPEEFPPMHEAIINGLSGTGVTLVFADNLYMYGKSATPMTENTNLAAASRKGKVRIELAARLLQAQQEGKLNVVIARGSDYFGPSVGGSLAGEDLFHSVLSSKKATWAYNAEVAHSLTYIDDFARALILLGETPHATGQVWHIPANGSPSGRDFLQMIFKEANLTPKLGVMSAALLKMVSFFVPIVREIVEIRYQFDAPFVTDGSKFQAAFPQFQLTPLPEAIRQTLAWYKNHPTVKEKAKKAA